MSTAYAGALGKVEDLARNKMNQRLLEYGYDAEKFDRGQEMARQMAENQEKYGAWQTQGGWDLQSQLANASSAMDRWALENQIGFQDQQGSNLYNERQGAADQGMMGNIIMSMMGR